LKEQTKVCSESDARAYLYLPTYRPILQPVDARSGRYKECGCVNTFPRGGPSFKDHFRTSSQFPLRETLRPFPSSSMNQVRLSLIQRSPDSQCRRIASHVILASRSTGIPPDTVLLHRLIANCRSASEIKGHGLSKPFQIMFVDAR
jgi:hypothetical protein